MNKVMKQEYSDAIYNEVFQMDSINDFPLKF